MRPKVSENDKQRGSNRVLELADKLGKAANRLGGRVEAAQCKHFVLPLVFLK